MTRTTVKRTIDAPLSVVFDTVAEIDNFSNAVSNIVNVERLSSVTSGVGTQFRETRLMNGKEATTELEITEYTKDNLVRFVADSHGTIWDTIFTVEPVGDQTLLTMTMDAIPFKLFSKVMIPLMKSMVKKAIQQDMDAVKKYCETQVAAG